MDYAEAKKRGGLNADFVEWQQLAVGKFDWRAEQLPGLPQVKEKIMEGIENDE